MSCPVDHETGPAEAGPEPGNCGMTLTATDSSTEQRGRRMSRACRGDDDVFAHEFCAYWNYLDGRRVYYCVCECHTGAGSNSSSSSSDSPSSSGTSDNLSGATS